MLYGAIVFYKSLVNFKEQANEEKIFSERVYTASMLILLFFLAAYLVVDYVFITSDMVLAGHLVIALVFFFGAIFTMTMVFALQKMSAAIYIKADESVKMLVNTVDAKDHYTRGHSDHVAKITGLIYDGLPDPEKIKVNKTRLMDAAVLHDIGKIGIPDNILNKPGKLTSRERHIIEQHARLGKNILEPTDYQLTGDIVRCHHERVDGKGYYKIPAEQIPPESKIIAVADTFSALCTDRIYRTRKSYDEAMRIIQEVAGTQLDEEIVRVFCTIPKDRLEQVTATKPFDQLS